MSGQGILNPHEHDVLSGRGNFVNYHAGNEHFRALVRQHKVAYVACPKPQKGKFSKMIVDEIRNRNPPGRFLKQDAATKLWYDIGEKKALVKTRQALREGAPDIVKELSGDTDEEGGVDEPHRSPLSSNPRASASSLRASNPGGMSILGGFSADNISPYGNVSSNASGKLQSLRHPDEDSFVYRSQMPFSGNQNNPSHPYGNISSNASGELQSSRHPREDSFVYRSQMPFSGNQNSPAQGGISSHISMPYGGLSAMAQQQQAQQIPQYQLQQAQFQLQQAHQQPQHYAAVQQAPVMRSVFQLNSVPALGLMQASIGQPGITWDQPQL